MSDYLEIAGNEDLGSVAKEVEKDPEKVIDEASGR